MFAPRKSARCRSLTIFATFTTFNHRTVKAIGIDYGDHYFSANIRCASTRAPFYCIASPLIRMDAPLNGVEPGCELWKAKIQLKAVIMGLQELEAMQKGEQLCKWLGGSRDACSVERKR